MPGSHSGGSKKGRKGGKSRGGTQKSKGGRTPVSNPFSY